MSKRFVRSDETRERMRQAHLGHAATFVGPHSEEAKQKISKANSGKRRSEETKEKIRIAMLQLYPKKEPKPSCKEFICSVCKKVCRTKGGLDKHFYYMHTPEGQEKIKSPRPALSVLKSS